MTTPEFLSHLRELDIKLWAEGDRLRYGAAKGVVSPAVRDELASRKAELLDYLRDAAAVQRRGPVLRRVDRSGPIPLSFAQQRLWFLDQLVPQNPLYNIPAALRFPIDLNVSAFERALNEIVRRHEALRTTFAFIGGEQSQVIAPELHLTLEQLDMRDLPPAEREGAALRIAGEQCKIPFDLATGPLLRTTLLRLDDNDYIFLLTIHHIIADGWSMGIFFDEMNALYVAFSTDRPSPLPELPIQYADFAAWQREWLEGEVLETQLSYWRRQLAGVATLQIPADRPRPVVATFQGASHPVVLSKALSDGLTKLSREEGATLFMTLLAAFQILLHRYTSQDDIAVGVPVANRTRAEVEGLIGFFVNALVMRTDLSGDPTFRELLARVRQVAVGAYAHQDVPFEKLVEELHPDRDLSRNPFFQVTFQLFNLSGSPDDEAESPLVSVEIPSAKFDIRLDLWETSYGLNGIIEYASDLFDAATIGRMLGHLETLLGGIVSDPDQRLSKLPLLTAAERDLLLTTWNDTAAPFHRDKCIHQLFEERVAQAPDASAVIFGDTSVTYGELNRRANQLSHYLRRSGVGPDTLVAICMERSIEMLAGILGIMKAGGVYVPLDPAYPAERLNFMLTDSQAPVLLSQRELAGRFDAHGAKVICVDADADAIALQPAGNPAVDVTPDNLVYAIYTSGSTGRPKGSLIQHRGLCNVACYLARTFEVKLGVRVLQFASLNFDASAFEIAMALPFGATLVLAAQESVLPGPALIDLLRDQSVSFALLPPSALTAMPEAALPDLKFITVAGEPFSPDLVEKWARGRRFFNLYGPTEASILTTVAECYPGESRITIGRPISNVQCFVLDKNMLPVPIGALGELCIGGIGVGRGYLNRPELTAEKFVQDPFSTRLGARLYRSGDVVRYLVDGNLEFLGRTDQQVKIRGFRIELGELEAAAGQHPSVREAAAVVYEETPGDKRLIVYVVPQTNADFSSSELLRFLQIKLPRYMVPAAIVTLDSLPLLPNGKLNRHMLPKPDRKSFGSATHFVAPRSELERKLTAVWQELFQNTDIGVHDDFFDLGGHSLLMVRVHNRLQDVLGIDLSIIELFQHPTINSLAEHLSGNQGKPADLKQVAQHLGTRIAAVEPLRIRAAT